MALVVNGETLKQRGYEFGVKYVSGHVTKSASFEAAQKRAEHFHAKVVFRAVYETDWADTL